MLVYLFHQSANICCSRGSDIALAPGQRLGRGLDGSSGPVFTVICSSQPSVQSRPMYSVTEQIICALYPLR